MPCLARNHAVETPTIPPPMMTTSALAGMDSGGARGRDQVRVTSSFRGVGFVVDGNGNWCLFRCQQNDGLAGETQPDTLVGRSRLFGWSLDVLRRDDDRLITSLQVHVVVTAVSQIGGRAHARLDNICIARR